ncbi:MAG: sensor histidine kinase [Stenotrophobium sp.]
MKGGLYRRLFLWFFVANMLTLLLSIVITERIARSAYHNQQVDWPALGEEAASIYGGGGAAILRTWARHWQRRGLTVALLDRGRNVLQEPLPPPLRDHLDQLDAQGNIVLHLNDDLTLASVHLRGPQGQPWLFLVARKPQWPPPRRLLVPLLVQVLMSLLMIGLVGWWVSRSIGKPVAAVQAAARRMASGDLAARVGKPIVAGSDELGLLARDFDHMAVRIEGLVEHLRMLLQDVSHELRSPLARLQLSLELARGQTAEHSTPHLDHAENEIQRLDHIIADMLALTRLEAKLPDRMDQPVNLLDLVNERIADLRSHSENVALRLEHDGGDLIEVLGQRTLLARALDNLLSNAVKYGGTPPEVDLRICRSEQEVALTIRDNGRGVPPAELGRLFRIYFRASNTRGIDGQGLGLAIVERIVRAHSGRCSAENSAQGGLQVTLHLPLRSIAAAATPHAAT